MSLKLHHLNASRSQRIVWLLLELGVPHEIVHHSRDPETRLAPAALNARWLCWPGAWTAPGLNRGC